MTASDGGLYKLLVIGGGPAGVGVFIRAARTGFLPRLLNPALHGEAKDTETSERLGMKQKGVAIVHDGDEATFGSGNLGKYVINSNTFARSLLSSVLDEKPELDPPESIKNTFLERARDHESTRRLEEMGNAPACLVDFGGFLQNVGACLLKEMTVHPETSKCLLKSRAMRFDRTDAGIYRVDVEEGSRSVTLYAENLVLAMGGQQTLPPSLESNPALRNKVFLSDDCLREDGFARLRDHLVESDGRKVCIVGGSHSSFSVAWLLLNKGKQRAKSSPQMAAAPPAESPSKASVSRAHSELPPPKEDAACVVVSPTAPTDLRHSDEATPASDVPTAESSTPPPSVSTPTPKAPPALAFQPRDITILHRSPIRCYYFTRKDAEADGADGSRVDRTGCVNTFTGLREDSKHLFKDIKAGRESRVRLFQVNQHGCQNLTTKAYESAHAIVWCCGYATRVVAGFDAHGRPLKFHEDHGVVCLNMQARVLLEPPPGKATAAVAAPNLFGVGLGFSLRSHVDEMGTEARADGVTVYHRRGATLVLAALFGHEVFGQDAQSFEEMVEKNDKSRKKKDGSAEPSLVERVKRSGSQGASAAAAASPASPMRTPSRSPHSSSISPEKALPARRLSSERKPPPPPAAAQQNVSQLALSPTNPPTTASCASTPARTATNPPVKMLLQRRRSVESLHARAPRSPGHHHHQCTVASTSVHLHERMDVRGGSSASGSMSKAAMLPARSAPFAAATVDGHTEPPHACTETTSTAIR